jgi:hypothetical protein
MLDIEAHHIEADHIEADHLEVARQRSSPPNISHSRWLSTVRGTRQSARWQFAILHVSTEAPFLCVIFVTRADQFGRDQATLCADLSFPIQHVPCIRTSLKGNS